MNILSVSCNLKLRKDLEQPMRSDKNLEEVLRHIISEALGSDFFDIVVVNDIKYNEVEEIK